MSLLKPQMRPELAVESFRFVDTPPLSRSPGALDGAVPQQNSPPLSTSDGEEVREKIGVLEDALADATSELERTKARAYEEGIKAGQEEARELSTESLSLLREAMEGGLEGLRETLENQSDAAIMIARAILRSMLGESADFPEHIVQTAGLWRQELEDSSVISLRVSSLDFPDSGDLAALEKAIKGTEIKIDPTLGRGACLFDLALGSLNASIPRQLENAERFLDGFEHGVEAT